MIVFVFTNGHRSVRVHYTKPEKPENLPLSVQAEENAPDTLER